MTKTKTATVNFIQVADTAIEVSVLRGTLVDGAHFEKADLAIAYFNYRYNDALRSGYAVKTYTQGVELYNIVGADGVPTFFLDGHTAVAAAHRGAEATGADVVVNSDRGVSFIAQPTPRREVNVSRTFTSKEIMTIIELLVVAKAEAEEAGDLHADFLARIIQKMPEPNETLTASTVKPRRNIFDAA